MHASILSNTIVDLSLVSLYAWKILTWAVADFGQSWRLDFPSIEMALAPSFALMVHLACFPIWTLPLIDNFFSKYDNMEEKFKELFLYMPDELSHMMLSFWCMTIVTVHVLYLQFTSII